MTNPNISMIQSGLKGLGYDPGPIDGLYGTRTGRATDAWQKAGGAPATSLILPSTKAMLYQGSARYPVTEIAIHCSATQPSWMEKAGLAAQLAEIRRWHMEDNGWRNIGYQWLLGRTGDVLAGRPETEIGAGIEDHNRGVIHICLIGGHGSSATDSFSNNFTSRQAATLRDMIQGISMRTGITRISGHNEYAAKACPGFNVPNWLKEPQ
jgi:peptidoglycan hydrolase-like protein with peptidoglycan-binding domain